MRIDVAFLPSLLAKPASSVCVVIDVLRATSTLVTLAARGMECITVVSEIEAAFAVRAGSSGRPPVLCGEVGGLPPAGFDFGNSPDEFSRLDLSGRQGVLFTSNGTKALVQLAGAPAVFVGALLNRTAVSRTAVAVARDRGLDLQFVCAGTDLGNAYCLEDAYCAGALVDSSIAFAGSDAVAGDGAETALRLFRSFGGDARRAFDVAEHGRTLHTIGLTADLAFCAQTDLFTTAPRMLRDTGRQVVIR